MARATPTSGPSRGPTVHNDGPEPVGVLVLVRDADVTDVTDVTAELVTLSATATTSVDAAPTAAVEVHTAAGSATASAHTDPTFVVREGSVLVAPE